MALSSQVTRAGLNRRSMSSVGHRRRRGRRWPWLVMIIGVAAVLFAIQWLSDDQVDEGSLTAPSQAAADAADEADDGQDVAGGSESTDTAAAASALPTVPSITLGAGNAASGTAAAPTTRPTAAASAQPTSPVTQAPTQTRTRMQTPAPSQTSQRTAAPAASAASAAADYQPHAQSQADVADVLRQGMELIAEDRLVAGRQVLSDLLFNHSQRLAPVDAQAIRDTLASVNDKLVFSPTILPDDPAASAYRVQRGDMLSRIGHAHHVPYPLLEQINGVDARRLQAGQRIKVIHGPFHARVDKSDYRMDIYLMPEADRPIYVRSFPVGLGESDSTPLGRWLVEPGRKVKNPAWVNPRTNERYERDDPANPIGDYWIALKGLDEGMELYRGYGIHGTVEPNSIGQQMSMGCIRLRDADIEMTFHLLQEGHSTVEIVP